MLKLYIGVLEDDRYGKRIDSPGGYVRYVMKDLSVFESDFGVRALKECSGIVEIYNCNSFKTRDGCYIGVDKVSGGVQCLMIMRTTDRIVNVTYCGDNCNKYIAEIAKEKDLTVNTTRFYDPFYRSDLDEVFVLNNNKVYKSGKEFVNDAEIIRLFCNVGNVL